MVSIVEVYEKVNLYNWFQNLDFIDKINWVEKNFKIGGIYTFDDSNIMYFTENCKIATLYVKNNDTKLKEFVLDYPNKYNLLYLGIKNNYPTFYFENEIFVTSVISILQFKKLI